jgi:predicted TIM-barrel fold metal-dependent hydrolase
MDEIGVHAQVLFPNVVGLGGSTLNNMIPDLALRIMCLQIYNDAMAEMMADSGNRFIPMTLMPAWDVDLCVEETKRAAGLGLRGINMTSDPQDAGSPDLASRAWDPLWQVCSDLHMPVHFHIGSSNTAMDFFGNYFWASQDEYVKPAIGGAMLFLNSARVVMNTIFSGVFDRFPDLTMVAVESGIGWIPFILETMDYELSENAPDHFKAMKRNPSEYFAKHWYATFWFEEGHGQLQNVMDIVGDERILFETDFPHPTCLYPAPVESVAEKMGALRPETQARVMGDNARKLYRL